MVSVSLPALTSQLAGRFQRLERAGAGGSSEVWRAVDGVSGATVALKIAHADAVSRGALAREASYAALALSPRLPELVDVGWLAEPDGRRAFLALRWEEGAPLGVGERGEHGVGAPRDTRAAAPARRGSLEERVALALDVARDVGEALGDLHAAGLAHGDIKPENLLLHPRGDVAVLDLGLAGPMHETTIKGATVRYLARGDADLGDARARDLIALGAVLAEIVDPEIAAANDPITAARSARLPGALDRICAALLAPSPGARPSAAWVADAARALRPAQSDRGERDARLVRATYLKLRRSELERATSARDDAAPWLGEAIRCTRRARSIEPDQDDAGAGFDTMDPLAPLSHDGVARWLTALAGPVAASWPLAAVSGVSEPVLAAALTALARRLPPLAWTLADVEGAALGAAPRVERTRRWTDRAGSDTQDASPAPLDAADAVTLALAVAEVPPDAFALEEVERRLDAPAPLVLAAAEALRLRGELGRARGLVLRRELEGAPGADAIAADVLRRAGDLARARERAERALGLGDSTSRAASPISSRRAASDAGEHDASDAVEHDASDAGEHDAGEVGSGRASRDAGGRALGVLARLAVDAGRLDEADSLTQGATSAPVCEARALMHAARGDMARALAEVSRGEALARTTEERARAAGLRGFVSHTIDPAGSRVAFAAAVDHAVRAGAVIEEATYRTGEAAAAVDLSDLGGAIATSRRAALLWEHLGRPSLAARALLASAAAYATAGAAHDTTRVALEAVARAREAGDARAEAYAWWAIADVARAGAEEGAAASRRAARMLEGSGPEDQLRAAARVLLHCPDEVPAERLAALDRVAAGEGLSAAARLDWWGARAARLAPRTGDGSEEAILAALTSLADARAPLCTRGPALAAGVDLAARGGQSEIANRLLASLTEAARELTRRAPPELSGSVRSLPWVMRAASAPQSGMRPEQIRDLETLIQSLSERDRLRPLLTRAVDALVLWTGVERGLLLLRAPDGRLVPRAARNLARSDLHGEQAALSQTLAARALEAREPVIAVDAAGELSSLHQSVHALKLRSVLAVPLIARGEVLGVVYLDDRVRRGAFGAQELAFTRTIASLAALAIADARDQVMLRRAARRARRSSEALAETLAKREALLDVTERELAKARGAPGTRFRYDDIVGESDTMRAMLKIVDRVTTTDIPVLINGESGSGKELVARAIHRNGPRAARAFVSENCGAIPEGLLESALFGHVRGAFTGADRPRAGLFEVADKGTLFLDEIGEMSLPMQTKLLRILEDGLLKPLGTERTRKVDVRVIAATHRDLEAMVRARTFREDLFYRLNIISIGIPPLRNRTGDIPIIIQHLLKKHAPGARVRITPAAMDLLTAYAWPGNVRQLENEIRRTIVLSDGVIDRAHLSADIAQAGRPEPRELGLNVRGRIDALETDLVRDALERTSGNQTQAAKLLGLSRFGLQKMIKRLAIG